MSWNRPTETLNDISRKSLKSGSRKPFLAYALCGVLVLAVGIVAWHLLSSSDQPAVEKEGKGKGQIKAVTPAPAPKAKEEVKEPVKKMPTVPRPGPATPDNPLTAAEKAAGHTYHHKTVTNYSNVAGEVAYKNGTEQVLLQIFSKQRGDMPLPLPQRLPDRDVKRMAEILIDKSEVSPDDSELLAASKMLLDDVKKEAREYIKEGGTIEDFIVHYHDELSRCYQIRKDTQKAVLEAARNEDPDVARAFCESMNKKLESQGIKKIVLPEQFLKGGRK